MVGIFSLGMVAGLSIKEEYFFPTEEKIIKAYIDYKSNEESIKNLEGNTNNESPNNNFQAK